MASQLLTEAVKHRPWQFSIGAVLLAVVFGFALGFVTLIENWTKADYSHGFLVVPFVAYLLKLRWHMLPERIVWPKLSGVWFFVVAVGLFVYCTRYNKTRETGQSLAIIIALAGVVWMFLGGKKAIRWALPALLLLLLTIPLPHNVYENISWKLRKVATVASTFIFQLLGFPAYHNTLEIYIGTTKLDIQAPCSGLSMLFTFITICAGIVLMCPPTRPWTDRFFILCASIPIAVICNIGRIIVTGLVYHAGWKSLGDLIVHSLAGWLMMPFALGMVWVLFRVIDWLYVTLDYVSTEEFVKVAFANTAEKMRQDTAVRAANMAAYKEKSGTTTHPPPRPVVEPPENPS